MGMVTVFYKCATQLLPCVTATHLRLFCNKQPSGTPFSMDSKVGNGQQVLLTAVGFFKSGRSVTPHALQAAESSIAFESEPTNSFDPNAVMVHVGGVHAAYVCRHDAMDAKAFLMQRCRYSVKVLEVYGASALLLVTITRL